MIFCVITRAPRLVTRDAFSQLSVAFSGDWVGFGYKHEFYPFELINLWRKPHQSRKPSHVDPTREIHAFAQEKKGVVSYILISAIVTQSSHCHCHDNSCLTSSTNSSSLALFVTQNHIKRQSRPRWYFTITLLPCKGTAQNGNKRTLQS